MSLTRRQAHHRSFHFGNDALHLLIQHWNERHKAFAKRLPMSSGLFKPLPITVLSDGEPQRRMYTRLPSIPIASGQPDNHSTCDRDKSIHRLLISVLIVHTLSGSGLCNMEMPTDSFHLLHNLGRGANHAKPFRPQCGHNKLKRRAVHLSYMREIERPQSSTGQQIY